MPTTPATNALPHIVSRNGHLISPDVATISVLGNVLYGAWGVYESLQLWDGVIFHLDDHLQRLFDSAGQIDLPLAGDLAAHRRWIYALIDAEADLHPHMIRQATVRLFAIGPDDGKGPASFVWLTPRNAPNANAIAEGIGAVTFAGERALPTAKSLNTLVNTMARRRAVAAGEHEGILVDHAGHVREGASSNFCAVAGDVLMAPPASDILEGVTLQIVLRLAEQAGVKVERRQMPLAERTLWTESFLTSTNRHVLPLVRLDGEPIGDGKPGPITKDLVRRFEAYFTGYIDQHRAP